MSERKDQPHVVIIGGGFAGLSAVRTLRRAPVRITLLDRRNHHLFQPLLYQVATAALNPGDIAYPIRSVVRKQQNARTILADARRIHLAERRLELKHGELDYDYLIVAAGVGQNYFGNDQWETWAPGLKSIEDALEIRRRVLSTYELAEREPDPERVKELLTFVVVGGGPTGVELAGALMEIGRRTVAKDFRRFDPRSLRVILVEHADRLIPPFPETLSAKARKRLEHLGVEVRCGVRVTEIDRQGVNIGDERINARTVLWAAGVAASPLGKGMGVETDLAGRVLVSRDLSVPDHPEVFVVGDLMSLKQEGKHAGQPVPGVAPAAIQSGRWAARNITRLVDGRETQPFRYRDKGSLATIGRASAVGTVGGLKLSGFVAWCMWWGVHIAYLVGFRNRLVCMMGWAWQFFTYSRGARLITGRHWDASMSQQEEADQASEVASPAESAPR